MLPFTLLSSVASAGGPPDLDDPLRTGARAPADSAVVVGIADYVFLPDVSWADRDATLVRDFLVSTRGLSPDRVTVLEGGSREQILAAVEAAGRDTGGDGVVWVYFAGHGVASPQTGHRLLLGDDTRQAPEAFDARGVELDALVDLAGAGGAQVVTWIDACFSGTGRDGAPMVSGTRFAVPVWATEAAPSTLGWAAAGPDQFARPLDRVRHGAFTWLSVGALRGWADGELDGVRDGAVSAAEASTFVERALERVGLRDQDPVLVGDSARWVLSPTAPERAPALDEGWSAPGVGGGLPPMGPAPRPVGIPLTLNADLAGSWDPALVAKADALQIHLPLRHGLLGYKDTDGERVPRHDFEKLARATRRGKTGNTLRTLGIPTMVAGMGVGMTSLALTFVNDDSDDFVVPGVLGGVGLVGGMVMTVAGQGLITGAVQPR